MHYFFTSFSPNLAFTASQKSDYNNLYIDEDLDIMESDNVSLTIDKNGFSDKKGDVNKNISKDYYTATKSSAKSNEEIQIENYNIATRSNAKANAEANVYAIETVEDLLNLRQTLDENHDITDIVLNDDIDMEGKVWVPFGLSHINFDGYNHTISNITIDISEDDIPAYGLFSIISNSVIRNLTIDNIIINDENEDLHYTDVKAIGGICGTGNGIRIYNCKVSGNINSINCRHIAGFIGYSNNGSITIEDCKSDVDINTTNSSAAAAGIITFSADDYVDDIVVKNCVNFGDITSKNSAGGFLSSRSGGGALRLNEGEISQCINYGTIKAELAGGIFGGEESDFSLFQCGNFGEIYFSGSTYRGGAAGIINLSNGSIKQCFNAGNIYSEYSGGYGGEIAGIVAVGDPEMQISDCYNCGNIYAGYSSNGIVNSMFHYEGNQASNIIRCYNAGTFEKPGDAIGAWSNNYIDCYALEQEIDYTDATCDGLVLLDNDKMKESSSFNGFDFDSIWTIGEDTYPYPVFIWQMDIGAIPNSPDIDDETSDSYISITYISPEKDAKNVKKTDDIIIKFNKAVSYNGLDDQAICIKDYDSDEVVFKYDTVGYGDAIFIRGGLKNCDSAHYYIYIPKGAIKAKIEDGDNTQFEFFEGITDKDQNSFWMENAGKIYVATFDSMGGSNVGNRSFEEGTQVRRPADPERAGYIFTGWYIDRDCRYEFDFNTILNRDIILYAGWEKAENQDFHSNNMSSSSGGSSSSSDENAAYISNNYSSNWNNEGDNWQCIGPDGKPLTGYQQNLYWNGIKGNWYFDETGNMLTGWHDGHYFNESANGYRGIEITDNTILGYIQGDDAKGILANYTYAATFVDDIDGFTKFGSSIKNWANELKATIVGFWNSMSDLGSLSQNIAFEYMKDEDSNKAVLADIVNEMFGTETWRQSYVVDVAIFEGSTIAGADKTQYTSIVEDYWNGIMNNAIQASPEMWDNLVEINNSIDKAELAENLFGTLRTALSMNQEFQKMMTDYTQNIAYLEDLKKSVSSESVLGNAIDKLIDDYKNQTITSTSNIALNLFKTFSTFDDLKEFNDLNTYIPGIDDSKTDILSGIVDELSGTSFGKVDAIIQLALSNAGNISAIDKVVYSTYLRTDAIAALNNAQQKLETSGVNDNNAVREYYSAFEFTKNITISQYKNMLSYYESGSYNNTDRQNKIIYLNNEIAKLEGMTFIDFKDYSSTPYYSFKQ